MINNFNVRIMSVEGDFIVVNGQVCVIQTLKDNHCNPGKNNYLIYDILCWSQYTSCSGTLTGNSWQISRSTEMWSMLKICVVRMVGIQIHRIFQVVNISLYTRNAEIIFGIFIFQIEMNAYGSSIQSLGMETYNLVSTFLSSNDVSIS